MGGCARRTSSLLIPNSCFAPQEMAALHDADALVMDQVPLQICCSYRRPGLQLICTAVGSLEELAQNDMDGPAHHWQSSFDVAIQLSPSDYSARSVIEDVGKAAKSMASDVSEDGSRL